MQSVVLACAVMWVARGAHAQPPRKFGMPGACAGSDYCTERHALYPARLVQQLLERANITFGSEAGERAGEAEQRDCGVLLSDDPIYEIVDARGNVRVVLQPPDGSGLQRVRLERCAQPGRLTAPTAHFSADLLGEYNLQCVQRKLDLAFLVLTDDWTGLEMVRAKTGVPVRCDCQLFQL